MTNQEALNKLETATTLMCEVLGVLKGGHNFTSLDNAIKVCYNIEDYLEKEVIRESKFLKYKNNWESDEYYVGGMKLDNIERVEIEGIQYDVIRRQVTKSYSDHGHTYTAKSWHYFIQEQVFGSVMEFDLNTVVNKAQVLVVK